MAEVFKTHGISTELKRIESSNPLEINKDAVIGLAFPVAGNTYPFVWDFISALPHSPGTKIFMVDTMAGFSGGVVGLLHSALSKKGYELIGAKEIIMPSNVFYVYPKNLNAWMQERGARIAQRYAEGLVKDRARWTALPLLFNRLSEWYDGLLQKIWFSDWNQKKFGFKVDKNKCSKCGICAALCPVDNIVMGEYPEHRCQCNFCMRCVSWCPQKAIPCGFNFKGKTYTAFRAFPAEWVTGLTMRRKYDK